MNKYEQQVFVKNGVKVNGVYVVKPRDTLTNIFRVTKNLGVEPGQLKTINPEVAKGLAPGQFIYFYTTHPRFKEQKSLVLNTLELTRTPYTVLAVASKSDFRKVIDQKVGQPNSWQHVFVVNNISVKEFQEREAFEFKIYQPESSQVLNVGGATKSFDQFLAANDEVREEPQAERTVAVEPAKPIGPPPKKNYTPLIGLMAFVILFAVFLRFMDKRRKKY